MIDYINLEWVYVDFSALSRGHTIRRHKLTANSSADEHYHHPGAHKKHPRQTFTLQKNTKIRKCTEMTCSLSSQTIALSFIYFQLHRKLQKISN